MQNTIPSSVSIKTHSHHALCKVFIVVTSFEDLEWLQGRATSWSMAFDQSLGFTKCLIYSSQFPSPSPDEQATEGTQTSSLRSQQLQASRRPLSHFILHFMIIFSRHNCHSLPKKHPDGDCQHTYIFPFPYIYVPCDLYSELLFW